MSLLLQTKTSVAGVSGLSPKSQARAGSVGGGAARLPRSAKRRVLGPDAGVEGAEDDALAGVGLPAELRPSTGGGVDELGAASR